MPHEDSDQEDPNELDPDQEAPDEVDPDKFSPKKLDLDAVVTLAAATFTSKTSSPEARSLRYFRANKLGEPLTNGPHVALHEHTVAVLNALAYVSVNESSPALAIGLTIKPLQLVVATNKEIPSPTIVEHLSTICSTLKNISDAKFCTCSDHNPSNADLGEESPDPDFFDENLEFHYSNLFLQIYKYSHEKLQTKHQKRWKVLKGFGNQLTVWKTKVTREQGNREELVEPHKTFFDSLNSFRSSGLGLRDGLIEFSRSGWKMDATEMDTLRSDWYNILADAKNILDQKVGGISMCDYWAMRVFVAGQQPDQKERPDKKEKPLQLRRAIEKLVAFHRHVFTLIRFANSKQMRSSFFLSKITVISAEKKHPFALSWPSKREWGNLLGSIYDKHGLTRESGSDVTKAEQKMKLRAIKCGIAATIHCECAMVAYLYQNAAFQAFSYIGVSKLCCKACHYWIEAFNCTMSTTFRTRGSHDKWYGGWARPGLSKAANQGKVDAMFLAFVEGELCKHQLGKHMARKSGASDSSGSHEPMVPTRHRGYKVSNVAKREIMYGRLY